MSKPLIVQSDNTLLLEVDNPAFEDARDSISPFAELEKSPEYMHEYRITPLSLWNAASAGLKSEAIIKTLNKFSRYDIPENVIVTINEQMSRYGSLKLVKENGSLILTAVDPMLMTEIIQNKKVEQFPYCS